MCALVILNYIYKGRIMTQKQLDDMILSSKSKIN